ncbi:MAG TPA: hypothetical protein VMV11_00410 [Acidimicrobiales bacterium]|nr:hypothetical protein [Acidimicrobiales bacterium]
MSTGRRLEGRGDTIDDVTTSNAPRESRERTTSTRWAQSEVRNSYQEASDAVALRRRPQTHVDVSEEW